MAVEFPILVSGGSGKLAGLVIDELLARGVPARQIVTTTRTPARLAALAKRGVEVREADFKRPETLDRALAGAARMLLISTVPDLPFVNLNRFRQHKAAIDAAIRAGVGHVFYTSAPNPGPPFHVFWKQDHYETEEALIRSGLRWTVLRQWEWPDWHFEIDWLPALESGRFLTPRGAGRVNHVTREDCARAIAGALLAEDSLDRCYDLTGPASLLAEDLASELAAAFGRPLEVVHCSDEEYAAHLRGRGMDKTVLPFVAGFAMGVRLGRYDGTTDWVERLSGKAPTSIRAFLETEAARRT